MALQKTLPDGWVWTSLGEITTCQSGSGFPKSYQGLTIGDYPLAKVSDITEATKFNNGIISRANNYLSTGDAKKIGAKIFPAGTTLFAKIGEAVKLNRRVVNSIEILADNNVMGLIPKTNSILPSFLYYFMHLVDLYEYTQATTVPSVRKTDIERIALALPPLPEQERIVAKIEELFTQLDAGVAALKRIQAGLKRYKASVLKAACEGKLATQDAADEPAAEVLRRLGKSPLVGEGLAPLPEGWVWVRMKDVTEKITDGTHFTPTYVSQGVAFISVKDIYNGQIHFKNCKFIPQSEHDFLIKRCHPEPMDVLITKSGTIGRIAVVKTNEPFSLFVSVALVKPLQEIWNSDCLAIIMENFINHLDIKQDVKGGLIKNLHIEDIKAIELPLPPLAEQQRIVAEVERRLSVAAQVAAAVGAGLKRAARLRQAILKRAFEGKLVAPGRER